MKISNNQSQQSNCLSLEGEITINEAAQLKEILLGYLTTEAPVAISLAHVTKIDTSGLQLLYAAHQTALHRGKKLSLENPSPAFMQAAKLAGLFFQSPTSAPQAEGYLEGCLWQGAPAASEEKTPAPLPGEGGMDKGEGEMEQARVLSPCQSSKEEEFRTPRSTLHPSSAAKEGGK